MLHFVEYFMKNDSLNSCSRFIMFSDADKVLNKPIFTKFNQTIFCVEIKHYIVITYS